MIINHESTPHDDSMRNSFDGRFCSSALPQVGSHPGAMIDFADQPQRFYGSADLLARTMSLGVHIPTEEGDYVR
jgi:hypothetical protein